MHGMLNIITVSVTRLIVKLNNLCVCVCVGWGRGGEGRDSGSLNNNINFLLVCHLVFFCSLRYS